MDAPRISVIIPSYNHARFIDAAVESVLEPDGPARELIVVEDGSTDDSLARLEAWSGDPRLRLYPQENQGAHAALNRGLELARGELIFILNSDDLFAPERLEVFGRRFDAEPDLALLCSWLRIIDADGKEIGVKEGWRNLPPWPQPQAGPSLAGTGRLELALLETNFIATTSNVAFRRELIDAGLRFQALRYAHDWDFILEAGRHGAYGMVEEPLVSYRVHGANTIGEGQDDLGMGTMRFEILWVVARHAARVLAAAAGGETTELRRRAWNSLPRFGRDRLLAQLLHWSDSGDDAAYRALLDPDHPFRQRAVELLAESDG